MLTVAGLIGSFAVTPVTAFSDVNVTDASSVPYGTVTFNAGDGSFSSGDNENTLTYMFADLEGTYTSRSGSYETPAISNGRFFGWAAEEDGEVIYTSLSEIESMFPVLETAVAAEPVSGDYGREITLTVADGEESYQWYRRKINVNGGTDGALSDYTSSLDYFYMYYGEVVYTGEPYTIAYTLTGCQTNQMLRTTWWYDVDTEKYSVLTTDAITSRLVYQDAAYFCEVTNSDGVSYRTPEIHVILWENADGETVNIYNFAGSGSYTFKTVSHPYNEILETQCLVYDLYAVYEGGSSSGSTSGESKTPAKQTIKVSNLKKTYKASALSKKAKTFRIKATTTGNGKISYKKISGKKKIKVNSSGKVTVKKGLSKGTYKVKVKVKASKTSSYKAASKTVTLKIKVK